MAWEGGHVVASTVHPLALRRGARARLREEGVLRALLLRPGDGTVTAWEGIDEVPGGHTLSVSGTGTDLRRYWSARPAAEWARLDSDQAEEVAAGLLDDAVRERCVHNGTALAMSGGMDSTALLASSGAADPERGGCCPDILSFRFPEGDPGDERWYIEAVSEQFALPVHWVGIQNLGFFDDVDRRALVRSNCHGHMFEGHNRALARTAFGLGDRVLLNGHGGDNVFGVGDWVMADLLRAGRWVELRRYFRARGYRGMRHFVDRCLRPAVPTELIDPLESVLGRHICSRPWERLLPPWLTPEGELVRRITEDDRAAHRRSIERLSDSVATQRRAWALMDSTFQRACSALFDLKRDEGVELRMPFYDRRIIEFVMARPTAEFNRPGRYKVLLQRAVGERLPTRDRVPERGMKPGTAAGIMEAGWADATRDLLQSMVAKRWLTEDLGLVDLDRFRKHVELDGGTHWHSAVDVGITLFVEAWVRAQTGAGRAKLQ